MIAKEPTFEEARDLVRGLVQRMQGIGIRGSHLLRDVGGGERHPLALWVRNAENAYERGGSLEQHSLRLTRLAQDVDLLSGVAGVDERLALLGMGTESEFWGTLHEISTAARYIRLGHVVEFIPVSHAKSPDLLVNGEVEVECKSRARNTDRRIRVRATGNDLLRRLTQIVRARGDAVGILAHVEMSMRPPPEAMRSIAQAAKLLLVGEGAYPVVAHAPPVSYRLMRYPPRMLTGPLQDDFRLFAGDADYIKFTGDVIPDFPNDRIFMSSYVQISVSSTEPEPLWNIQNVLKKAAGQLSGLRPGVIEVEINAAASQFFAAENSHLLLPRVEKALKDYSRISVVRMIQGRSVQRSDGLRLSSAIFDIPNENPKFELPEWMGLGGFDYPAPEQQPSDSVTPLD